MRFCLECGNKLNADAVFCMNCGASTKVAEENTPQNEEVPQAPQENVQVRKSPPSEPKKPMSKAKKLTLAIVAVLGVGLIGTHLFLTNHYDPMKKIDAMNEAFNKKEKAAFYEYFEVPKDTIANADQLYAVVQDITWQNLRSELVYEIDKIKEKQPTDTIRYNGDFLYLDKKPVLFGLYKEVTFNLIPTEVSVQLPFENMNVTIAGQTIQSESDDEIIQVGNFIPGTYEWSYELEKNHIELSDEGSISIYQDEYNQTLIDIDWGFKEAYLYSELEDAILYVNGQSTEKNVQELSRLYPVSLNGKSELHLVAKDGEGKEVLSEKVKLDHEEIDFSFPHLEKERLAQEEALAKEQKQREDERAAQIKNEELKKSSSVKASYRQKADALDKSIIEKYKIAYPGAQDMDYLFLGQYFTEWDDLLQEVWEILRKDMPGDKFETLKAVQIKWIQEKERLYGGDPGSAGGRGEQLGQETSMTQTRVYELIEGYLE